MKLCAIEIENFQSLENVSLHGLKLLNVLIGRNNSGKSAVFRALKHLGRYINNDPPDAGRLITDQDQNKCFKFSLLLAPSTDERDDFLRSLPDFPYEPAREGFLQSPFLTQLHSEFRSAPGGPGLIHLMETQIMARDGVMATVQKCTDRNLTTSNPTHDVLSFDGWSGDRASPEYWRAEALMQTWRDPTATVVPLRPSSL